MGDSEDQNGSGVPPKEHVRFEKRIPSLPEHEEVPCKEEIGIVETEIPEPPAEDSVPDREEVPCKEEIGIVETEIPEPPAEHS